MKHHPKVSVIMPAFNASRTLREAVDSILKQTFPDLELIVCNDASTDKTSAILSNIPDKRLKVLNNDFNMGPGLSRDKSIAFSKGEMIAVVDADDTWVPERLQVLLDVSKNEPDAMVFDDILECHDTPSGMIPWKTLRGKTAFGGNGMDSVDVPVEQFVCLKRLLIKPIIPASFIKKHGVKHSSLRFAEDTEFFLKLISKGLTLKYVPFPMYHYRITPGSASANQERTSMMLKVLMQSFDDFQNNPARCMAFKRKIEILSREEKYMSFIHCLKNNDIRKALYEFIKAPWLMAAFIRRSAEDCSYHIHRIRHRGKTRGSV
jgi:glycosyltransferase involved in cell wall biosynthesis